MTARQKTPLSRSPQQEPDGLLRPEASQPSEEHVASLPETATKTQQVAPQIVGRRSYGRFAEGLRRLLRYEESRPIDPAALAKMDIEDMLAILLEESRKRTRWKRLSIGIGVALIVLILGIAAVTNDMSFHTLFAMCAPISLLIVGGASSVKQQTVAAAMAEFDDIRAVGPLAEALEFDNERILPLAETALLRLLPRLKSSDASLLDPTQRACLNRALWGPNTALALAILTAWEQVGDADAIPEVQALAEGRRRYEGPQDTENSRQTSIPPDWRSQLRKAAGSIVFALLGRPRVVLSQADRPQRIAAAQECLPALYEGVERRNIGSQLLRPSNNNRTSHADLLRPTGAHMATEPSNQLLRASEEDA